MKQIFDWLREQIEQEETPEYDRFDKGLNTGLYVALDKVNQAEAKWEAEACEWEYNEFEEQWETSCGVLLNPNSDDREVTFYCCNCGKPIKISEVE